jgi:7-keto-8-aminopelargonate synthetase-like enzyme
MIAEPERLGKLRQNGAFFLAAAKSRGLNVGSSVGASIVPVIVGDSPTAVILSERLLGRGFNVVPAIYPGVPDNEARLRFFLTSEHRQEQMEAVLDAVSDELSAIRRGIGFAKPATTS